MTNLEKYAYTVFVEGSFSAAAKELFISQPALSASVARLEGELGFRIFDRSTVPLSLTTAGRIYMDSLEEIMESERHMQRRIRQLSETKSETLSIGASAYIAYDLLPKLCRAFSDRYPDIRLQLNMGSSPGTNNLRDELKQQNLDLLLSHTYDSAEHLATPLLNERMIVAMHKDLPGAEALRPYAVSAREILEKSYPEEKELEDFSLFRQIRFFRFRKGSPTYQRMAKILGDYAATAHTITHVPHSGMHYNMMCAGFGALLTTDTNVAFSMVPNDDLLFFVPKCPESHRTLYLIRQAGVQSNPLADRFVAIATEFCGNDPQLSEKIR